MSKRSVFMKMPNGDVFETYHPEYHKECEQIPRAEGERLQKEQYRKLLTKWLKPGSRVYTKLESVSSSGMTRRISLYAVVPAKKGSPAYISNITGLAAAIMGYTVSNKGGIQTRGCGMDMGFHLVYALGHSLWPKGTKKPHGSRNGEPDCDGGYALKHEWL